MQRVFKLTFLACLILSCMAVVAQTNPVKWSAKSVATGDNAFDIVFSAEIDPSWHMYDLGPYGNDGPNATVFTFEAGKGVSLVGSLTPATKSKRVLDEVFGIELGYYETSAKFTQKVKITEATGVLKANVEWMSCDNGACTSPADQDFTFDLGATQSSLPIQAAPGTEASQLSTSVPLVPLVPIQSGEVKAETENAGSMWSVIIEAILWGFAALLTPCVFPMVPMTVSLFMKTDGSAARGRAHALLYGFFIVALYTIPIAVIILITRFVGGDAITADIFNWLATHWLPNVIFFLVFMLFAASFFGAFEITMPSWMVNKSDQKADKGGIGGLFFMAVTLVLVSFSCTGPIVGSVLIKSTSGEFWEPIITMFAFSTAFALPFMIFALFPSMLRGLPKSGGWLNSVKVVLGFIEVALGLKFLSVADQTYHWGLLDREIYLAIWIVVFSLLGIYLLGKLKFAHDSEVKHVSVTRLMLSIITFSFVVYLIPGMFGAPLKGLSGYLPPMHTQDFVMGQGSSTNPSAVQPEITVKYGDFLHLPHGLNGFFDYEQGMAYAKSVDKPLFLDFTGHGCVNCREMEARVWSDRQVLDILRNDYVIVALYSDDKKVLPEADWVTTQSGKVLKSLGKINSNFALTRFGVNAQPYYVILNGEGEELVAPRGYDLNVENFVQFLKSGVEAYKKAD